MEKFILSAHELFLLCALRKTSVQAKNLKAHTWTIEHESEFHNWLKEARHQGAVSNATWREKREELKNAKKGPQPELRTFELRDLDFGSSFSLVDVDTDMTWYEPETRHHFHDWDYREKFELKGELTEKEQFILKHFG